MKKLISIATLVLLLATTLISQLGCTEETEEPVSESNQWLELLRVLPANDSTFKSAYLEDIASSMEKTEKYPDILAGYEIMYLPPFSGLGPLRQYMYSDEELKQTLGFISTDVDQKIYAGTDCQNYYQAVRGRFSREDIDDTVKTGPMNPADLVGTSWQLVSMNGEQVTEGLSITLTFDSDSEASGRAGCFDYMLVDYEANGDDIRWGMIGKRNGELPQELEFQALHYTDSIMWGANYRLTKDSLEIYMAKGDTLVYKSSKEENI